MKVIKYIGLGLITILVLVIIGGFFLPSTAKVERSIDIAKPQAELFNYLIDFDKFKEWSPWQDIDPATQYTFTGPEAGVGTKMSWSSEHPRVGKGSQEIVAVEGQEVIKIDLYFDGQYGGLVHYRLTQESADSTKMVWQYETDFGNNPFGRYIGLLIEGMLGPYYEVGLQKLKANMENSH